MNAFEIMTPYNTQRITLNDNGGSAPPEELLISKGVKSIYWAVATYARRHDIPMDRVGYSTREAA